jgi:outer membrane receptor protein involved in Fe transport
MFQMKPLSLAVRAALGVTTAAVAVPAMAQEQITEEIVVTGSRIERANNVTSSPVAQLDAEQFTIAGTTRVEDTLRALPQVYLDQDSGQSIESEGTATLQLRNLGVSRTLVLVDGKRLPINSPTSSESGADLNFIPAALVDRVEVLTGGASAAYGSDAVAGVVNFIMKDDFEGVSLDYQYSVNHHDNSGRITSIRSEARGFPYPSGDITDGDIADMTFMIGTNVNDGRGNITAYATYRDIEAVTQSERDYSACALQRGLSRCGGSGTSAAGTFYFAQDNFNTPYFVDGDTWQEGVELYNFAPPSYYQRPDERYTLGAFGHYELSEAAEVYTQLMFMDDRTVAQFAPAGFFFDYGVDISCSNPLISAQQAAVIGCEDPDDSMVAYIGRRNVEGGPRAGDLRHSTYRGVFGVRGDINEAWRYDVSYQYAEVDMRNTNLNYLDTARIGRALDVVLDDGEIVCRSAADGTDPACVPWNIFQEGGVTQEAVDYLSLRYFERGQTDQTVFTAYVEGSLGEYGIQLPWAENGMDVVLGFEQREENLNYEPDDASIKGDIGGLAAALVPVDGGFHVDDYFIEASLPLVEGRPWMESVVLDFGYRYSDYDTDAEADAWKVATSWSIDEQVMLRASFQRAVRAANIVELFQPINGALFSMEQDPCGGVVLTGGSGSGVSAEGYTFEQCARSGVSLAIWDAGGPSSSPAAQYNTVTGGNESLDPEESDTWSAGFVVQPNFLEGLTVSVDYYDIKVEDAIDTIEGETTLRQCIENNVFCNLVFRGPADTLWLGNASPTNGVQAVYQNIGFFEVKGIDVETTYARDIGDWGTLSVSNVLGYVDTWEQEEYPGAGSEECQGKYGGSCELPLPELRSRTQIGWSTPWNVLVNLTWRHIDQVEHIQTSTPVDIDSFDYFDLAGIWTVNEMATIRAGVNNMFDKDPPITDNGATDRNNGNTYPGIYDHLGQYWFLGATVQF